jgi:aldose 1-epimerase
MLVNRHFGLLEDGRSVRLHPGQSDALQAEVLTYGAILHRLSYPIRGQRRELILAQRLAQYERDPPTSGRWWGDSQTASRRTFRHRRPCASAVRNENGNHLHGGATGVGKRLWKMCDPPSDTSVRLELHSPAGEEGYPGNLDIIMNWILPDALRFTTAPRRFGDTRESDLPPVFQSRWTATCTG